MDRPDRTRDAEERHDEGLYPAEAEVLHPQHQKDIERGDDDADLERDAEQEIEADGGAHHLGDVGGDDGDLGKEPQRPGDLFREGIAAGLRQIAPGCDGKPGAQRLQDDRHDV